MGSLAASPNATEAPPALAIKPIGQSNIITVTPLAPNPASPAIVTRKEWIIPPRPKPGRKPATDTPPTKRKAQNRAAQRAFRERRAARVGELEEELEETKEAQQKREADMKKRILLLEADIRRFNDELHSWKMRCDTLDRIVEYEKKEKEAALVELSYVRSGALTTGTDAVPIPPRRLRQKEVNAPRPSQFPVSPPLTEPKEPVGCGNCSPTKCACVDHVIAMSASICGKCDAGGHCECLEESIKAASDILPPADLKRTHSPVSHENSGKRHRPDEPDTPLEIDFTTQFNSKPKELTHITQDLPTTATAATESCGFCEDGTYCVCAEAAANTIASTGHETQLQLTPVLNEITPPPSDTDGSSGNSKQRRFHPGKDQDSPVPALTNPCINGPGTCEQCQSDPRSGLFCKSLAALRDSSAQGACCGGNAQGGACCKSLPATQPTHPPPSLSCADAYKTLSTHKNFERATNELNSWIGDLQTAPLQKGERAPMEIEAASVMGVLRLFDRRFGRE